MIIDIVAREDDINNKNNKNNNDNNENIYEKRERDLKKNLLIK